MLKTKLSLTEKLILLLVAIILVIGCIFLFVNISLFEKYTAEDGLAEWLTVIGLLLSAFVCFRRFIKYIGKKNWMFLIITLLLGLMLFAVAGEEISWGQRILGLQTPEYFQKNNLQKETNFHNLVVNGVKINQVVFSIGLITILAIYLLILPFLYRKKTGIKKWIDSWGIVLPQNYQVFSFLLLFALTALMKHDKNAELLECGAGLLFFLIVRYPLNQHIFQRSDKK